MVGRKGRYEKLSGYVRGLIVDKVQHTQETLCMSHIYALAGMAGVNYTVDRYDYGVDGRFIP